MNESRPILSVTGLTKHFQAGAKLFRRGKVTVQAVDDVSFSIEEGETLGMVGESGCGKTTIGRTIVRLYKPTSGSIVLRSGDSEVDISGLSASAMKPIRKHMQIIYQDPYSSLNPRMTVGSIIEEPLLVHGIGPREKRRALALSTLEAVGLKKEHMVRYPHEFSGGQRQRIAIAKALVLRPGLVIADEPVSALDVSIQAQVLNLLEDLQKEFSLTYLFIAHNLSVVRHISDRIAVMYLGKLVELAGTEDLFLRPLHPYTEALMSAIPLPDPDRKMKRITLQGDVPSPINPPSGCRFHPRCSYAAPLCSREVPELGDLGGRHFSACHFAGQLDLRAEAGMRG